jgi:hypothetical protein
MILINMRWNKEIPNLFNRKCPKCNVTITYKSKYARNNSENKKLNCKSCSGKLKTLTKEHKEKIGKALKGRKLVWNDKIWDSRRRNGNGGVSEHQKDWLRKNSVFTKTGEDSVRIQSILKEKNISYEEYLSELSEYKKYQRQVRSITNNQPIHTLENYDKPRDKCGVSGAYQLDHIIPVRLGFEWGIEPERIGDISNLRFIDWETNLKKSDKLILDVKVIDESQSKI